jgi:hypothetical protein
MAVIIKAHMTANPMRSRPIVPGMLPVPAARSLVQAQATPATPARSSVKPVSDRTVIGNAASPPAGSG